MSGLALTNDYNIKLFINTALDFTIGRPHVIKNHRQHVLNVLFRSVKWRNF